MTSFDVDQFYVEHWRRRPVLLIGCADSFVDPAVGWPEVQRLRENVDPHADQSVRERADGRVLFVNQVQMHSTRLKEATDRLAELMGWDHCSADLSVTRGAGTGIGAHFDHSDNFVVQQQGVKSWLVGHPEDTPERHRRARMLEVAGFVPHAQFPHQPLSALLKPGDVLYLPIFAPHEGVQASGDDGSISVSFSYNAESALSRYGRSILSVASEHPSWWKPLPLTGTDAEELMATLRDAVRHSIHDSH
jgi:50S ribosomal protein L16 3-hydroxylase